MKAQRLRSFSDFLKRAEIIPQALLVITESNSEDCDRAIMELRALNYEIPFYELNLSDDPNLKNELKEYCQIDSVPTFIYFRGKKMISQITGFDHKNNVTQFLTTAVHQLDY